MRLIERWYRLLLGFRDEPEMMRLTPREVEQLEAALDAPALRTCEWCGRPLTDPEIDQRFCSPTHRTNAKRLRNRPSREARKLEHAWSFSDGTLESHQASCAAKIAYRSFGDALQALRWLRERVLLSPDEGAAYKCLACGQFHVTSHGRQRKAKA